MVIRSAQRDPVHDETHPPMHELLHRRGHRNTRIVILVDSSMKPRPWWRSIARASSGRHPIPNPRSPSPSFTLTTEV